MLISGPDLLHTPVLSLQTGGELAKTSVAIINPHNLAVIAYQVAGTNLDHEPSLLRVEDIREVSQIGIIIDSSDEFVQPVDIIKLNSIYELHFSLERKSVLDEKRNKVGKVIEYVVDSDSFTIQQIIVKRPFLRSFNDPELIIHRSQIVEVTDHAIVIQAKAKINQPLPKTSRNYVNPFRQSTPQVEGIQQKQDE